MRLASIALLGLLASSCGDARTTTPPVERGVLTFDASMLGGDVDAGSVVPADAGPRLDAGPPPVDAGPEVSRYPDVPITYRGEGWDGLVIEALHIVPDEIGRVTEMMVVIRNTDPTGTFCSLTPDFIPYEASGTQRGFIGLVTTGRPYQPSIVVSCLGPGEIGLAEGSASGILDPADVARMEVRWFGSYSVSPPRYGTVTAEASVVDPYGGGTYHALEGRLEVLSGAMRNPDVTAFPKVGGLPVDRLADIELVDVYAGSSWSFTTTAYEGTFTDYWLAYDYRSPTSAVVAETPETRATLEAEARWQARRARIDERR